MFYKVFIYCVLLSAAGNAHQDYTFTELVKLQNLNKTAFDSLMQKGNFHFTNIQENKTLKTRRDIFKPAEEDSTEDVNKIERSEDTVYFGKKHHMVVLVTVSLFSYNLNYYNRLIEQCKNEGFNFRGAYTVDLEYPEFKTDEYRRAATVAQFSTGKPDGKDVYRISLSRSPK